MDASSSGIEEMSIFGKTNRTADGGASEIGVLADDQETSQAKQNKPTNKHIYT